MSLGDESAKKGNVGSDTGIVGENSAGSQVLRREGQESDNAGWQVEGLSKMGGAEEEPVFLRSLMSQDAERHDFVEDVKKDKNETPVLEAAGGIQVQEQIL